ncbi:MAG: peptidylprolyl isomerase [Bacteroidia bacterium]
MSILETIRRRANVFIVILIGGALLVFILEDALTSGRFFFGGNENVVAVANGQKLQFKDLNNKIEEVENIQKYIRQTNTLDNDLTNQIQQSIFSEMISEMVMGAEFKKLGLSLTDDELTDLMLGEHLAPEVIKNYLTDPRTGKLYEQIVDPRTGGVNRAMWVNFVKNMNDKQEYQYKLTEEEVKVNQLQDKYIALIKNSFFCTDAQAKQEMLDESKYYNISYVLKKYNTVPDNSVTVSDQDIESYYNSHLYNYSQPEESRKVDYVAFLATPTDKDMTDLQNEADSIARTIKTIKPSEDSAYITAESDDHLLDPNYHKAGMLSQAIDSVMSHAEKGFVYGPYRDMNKIKVAKLLDVAYLPDSAKASHILIAPADPSKEADWETAKKTADSIKEMVTKENFADVAKARSMDPGSKDKGGDIGWFNQEAQMVPEFIHACFFNNKGDIVEVKSQFGYHIIYITDQDEKSKYLHVGIVTKNIVPSTETLNSVYSQASSFAGKNTASDVFESMAGKMNKREAEFKENDPSVPGLTSPKDLIRWAYTAKAGDISPVFDVGGFKFIVAHLMQITPKGQTPLELVKDQVREKAMQEKKAEKLIADMKTAMQGVTNVTALGQKLNTPAANQQRLSFQMYSIPGLGKEDELLGTMVALKPNTLSQPIEGELGVYVIQVDTVYMSNAGDYKMVQQQQQQALQNRAQYDVYDALQKKANFVSHLGKYY